MCIRDKVNADAASNSQHDNLDDALADGRLTRDALVRSAMNICRTVMNSPGMEQMCIRDRLRAEPYAAAPEL